MTKSDFIDWKNNPITKQVFNLLQERVAGLKDELVGSVINDSIELSTAKAGAIMAYRDILDIEYEDTNGD